MGTQVNLLKLFINYKETEEWCKENFLRYRVLSEASKVYTELISICNQIGWRDEETLETQNPNMQLHCLVNAFPHNLCIKMEEKTKKGWFKYRCLNGKEAF